MLDSLGNDIYIVDNAGDVVEISAVVDDGVDIVHASVTYTVPFGIQNLSLTGAVAIDGTGNEDNNVITGNSVNNVLSGLDGNDQLNGGRGNDTLDGGSGNDELYGNCGNDLMRGGAGADTLTGGPGNDRYDYDSVSDSPAGAGRDRIVDFAGTGAGIGDQIDLATIDANTVVSGNQAFIFGGPFTAGHLRYVGGVLQGNTDADAAAEIEIALVGGPPAFSVGGAGSDILL